MSTHNALNAGVNVCVCEEACRSEALQKIMKFTFFVCIYSGNISRPVSSQPVVMRSPSNARKVVMRPPSGDYNQVATPLSYYWATETFFKRYKIKTNPVVLKHHPAPEPNACGQRKEWKWHFKTKTSKRVKGTIPLTTEQTNVQLHKTRAQGKLLSRKEQWENCLTNLTWLHNGHHTGGKGGLCSFDCVSLIFWIHCALNARKISDTF